MSTNKLSISQGLIIIGAALAVSPVAIAGLADGVYTEQALGHNAPFEAKITVTNGKISAIDSSKNLETNGVGRFALTKVGQKIITNQSLGVDVVTGATVTSKALLAAVSQALTDAGAKKEDLQKWQSKTEKHDSTSLHTKSDVVVIGGGGSGLAAAISALQSGAKRVTIIEKLGFLGGSTQVSGGAFNAVDDERQKRQGIQDSFPVFFEATMRGGHYKGDSELVHYLTYNSIDALHWLESLGVEFREKIGAATGSLGQRSHYGKKPAGWAYTSVLEERLKDFGKKVTVLTDCEAQELVQQNGSVKGVRAIRYGVQPVLVDAKAVIITTGGFGANREFRQKVNTGVWKEVVLDDRIGTTNINAAAQGKGIELAQKVGADIIGLSDIQLHPNGTPGTGLMQDIATSGRNRVFINMEGNRFVNEGAARDTLSKAIYAQPGGTYYLLMNKLRYPDETAPDRQGITMKDMLALGRVIRADTLDEMAQKLGVPVQNLKDSINEYNKAIKNKGTPDKYGFIATNTDDAEMIEGPWYACKKVPTVHHTMGGIRIDVMARALNADGIPIQGLFAAGEVTGGIHGANRLGGNAIADVFTFGRVAGHNAAEFANK